MWYAVLRRELPVPLTTKRIRAGSIYHVRKYNDQYVLCTPVEGESAKVFGDIKVPTTEARTIFTRPTRDFNDAVEESFMQCEANYC